MFFIQVHDEIKCGLTACQPEISICGVLYIKQTHLRINKKIFKAFDMTVNDRRKMMLNQYI